MTTLSSLGIGLSLVFGCFLLALVAEVYYLLWWKKKRIVHRDLEHTSSRPAGEFLLSLFCWKRPSSLSSTALNPQQICPSVRRRTSSSGSTASTSDGVQLKPFGDGGVEDGSIEAELMRLHNLSGPPRLLFTIKEETKEDLVESEDGRSRKGSRGRRSLSDVLLTVETPFLTPLSSPPFFTPPMTPLDCYTLHHGGFNPLFESTSKGDVNILRSSSSSSSSSPPPKFKFLKDAEEKLYRKTLVEEALRAAQRTPAPPPNTGLMEEDDGSFITFIIGKNREKGQQHHHHHHYSSVSQVTPLPSSPSGMRPPAQVKLITHLGSKQ